MKEIVLLVALVFSSFVMCAQPSAPNVKPYLTQIAGGWLGDAKKALPDLLIEYPDDPSVTFLHASLVDDAKRAKPLLERIIQAYPKSEFADDALLRLIVEAATLKELEGARKLFTQMREQYPNSELLWVAYHVLRSTVGVPPPTPDKPAVAAKKPEPPAPATVAAVPKVVYSLKIASTSSKQAATRLVDSFKKKRMRVKMLEVPTTKKNTSVQYVVLVGEYDSEAAANKDAAVVKEACKCKPVMYSR